MLMDSRQFLETGFGTGMKKLVKEWDRALEKRTTGSTDEETEKICAKCLAQWEVYKQAMKQFLGIEFCFTRTDDYFGVCTEDESVWLIKVYKAGNNDVPPMYGKGVMEQASTKNEYFRKREALRQAAMETMEEMLSTDLFVKAAQRCQEDYRFLVIHNVPLMAESIAGRYERILHKIGN